MKKTWMLTGFLVLLVIQSNGQSKKIQDLIGRYEIAGEDNAGYALEISDSATIVFTYMGEKRKILDYKFDFSKSPAWFDFTIQDTSSVVNVKSLFEIIDDSMIKWQLFVDEDRTDHFSSSKGELFYLRKARPIVLAVVSSNH